MIRSYDDFQTQCRKRFREISVGNFTSPHHKVMFINDQLNAMARASGYRFHFGLVSLSTFAMLSDDGSMPSFLL